MEAVKNWNGAAYDAIVLAGKWMRITAAEVYLNILAGIRQHDSFTHCLANMVECDAARHLLEQMICSVCHTAFNKSTLIRRNLRGNNHLVDWNRAVKNSPLIEQMAPVPFSTGNWNYRYNENPKNFVCEIRRKRQSCS